MKKEVFDEEEGVTAIIYLQALVGIVEAESIARVNWQRFSDGEKRATINFYRAQKEIRNEK